MAKTTNNLYSCWPDGYSRYYSVSKILETVYGENEVSILDVGGDSKWMSEFLDATSLKYALNILDTRKPDFENKRKNVAYTQKDFFTVSKGDFPSDAVINTDVLEHIPKNLKAKFVQKCIEIADSLVILSAPQDNKDVTFAEKNINDYYLKYEGKPQRWLDEHFEFTKPDPVVLRKTIEDAGYQYLEVNTNNLDNWLYTFTYNLTNTSVHRLQGTDQVNQFYNKNIHQLGDFQGTPYRKIFIVFKDKQLFNSSKSKLQSLFISDESKKTEFIARVNSLYLENIAQMSSDIDLLTRQKALLEQNLKQTQEAFVETSKELNTIKQSKLYKLTSRIKKRKP